MKNEKAKDEENKEIKKPLEIAMEDAKRDIVKAINNIANENKLTYYFLEIIISDLHNELAQKSKLQVDNLKENYENIETKEMD